MKWVLTAAVLVCVASTTTWAAVTAYSQDFEGLSLTDPSALANDGWLVFGNVFNGTTGNYMYGYGPYPAPNGGEAFCAIVTGEGGTEQGAQQLSVYNDYNNLDHGNGNIVEANVFQEQTIAAADVGKTYVFRFDAKLGNLEGSSTAAAFFKTLDPSSGYALTNLITVDMTTIPTTWGTYSILISIDAGLTGQILQFGFLSRATNYEGAGIYYDNLHFGVARTSDAPPMPVTFELHQNVPNPFNPTTRIDFDLVRRDDVDVSVYDVTGRRVVNLSSGELDAGPHSVTWNGTSAEGAPVAAGVYWYVLETSTGRTSRSMTLVK